MNDVSNEPAAAAPSAAPSPQAAQPADEGYEAVTGLDAMSVKLERQIEAKAAAKTASDYEHVVWAYGVIWALFAIYGMFLWGRAGRIRADVDRLAKKLGA
jgi:hypothetical protein